MYETLIILVSSNLVWRPFLFVEERSCQLHCSFERISVILILKIANFMNPMLYKLSLFKINRTPPLETWSISWQYSLLHVALSTCKNLLQVFNNNITGLFIAYLMIIYITIKQWTLDLLFEYKYIYILQWRYQVHRI